MASGDTKTDQYLDIAANGSRADLPSDTCCETRSQTLIRGVAERIMDVEDEVEELKNNPDVVDIVATYADLQAYDTQHLTDKDIIRVLEDETHDGESTYYRYNKSSDSWTYVGSIAGGTTYTAGDGINITDAIISATNTGKPRVLTTADYDYHKTGDTDNAVALWRLENGLYYVPSDIIVYRNNSTPINNAELILISRAGNVTEIISFSPGLTDTPYWRTFNDTGLGGANGYITTPVKDNLTSTSKTQALSANQGKVLKGLIDSISQSGSGAPTTTTVGTVGQLYQDTTNGDLYICTAIVPGTDPDPDTYTWEEVGGGGITPVQTTGTSTTDVMSQNATTSMIYASPADKKHIRIGENANAQGSDDSISIGAGSSTIADYSMALGRGAGVPSTGRCAVAIGQTASASGPYSVALGAEARTGNVRGVVAIGVLTANGYNSSNYRLLTGLYDGQSAHDAATKGQLDSIAIQNAGAPTTSTVGTVGQLLEDTTNGKLYQCTAIDTTDPQNPSYTWTEVGAGGSGPTVVQTTGTSTTDVMSQNAVTSMIFADPATQYRIKIGAGASSSEGNNAIEIGHDSAALSVFSVAIGREAYATGNSAVSLGSGAKVTNATNAVAIGYNSNATVRGEVSFGGPDLAGVGYNNTQYRLLTNVYDGQSAHDAATVGQITPTTDSSAPTSSTAGRLGEIRIDTTDNSAYMCVVSDSVTPTYEWKKITA